MFDIESLISEEHSCVNALLSSGEIIWSPLRLLCIESISSEEYWPFLCER